MAGTWVMPDAGISPSAAAFVFYPATIPLSRSLSTFPSTGLHGGVLFMDRAMEEILDRQERMPARLAKPAVPGADIAKTHRQQVRHAKSWLTGRGSPALSVSYADLVHRPDEALPPPAAFPGLPDRLEAMRAVIDPGLHRTHGAVAGTLFSPSSNPADGARW